MNYSLLLYWGMLSRYLLPQRFAVVGLGLALLSSISLQLIGPQLLRQFIDLMNEGSFSSRLWHIAYGFIAITLGTQILAVFTAYLGSRVAWGATNALRVDLVQHCLGLDLAFYQNRPSGELIARVDGDVNALSRFFSQFTIHLLGNGILLVGILVALGLENIWAGLCFAGYALISLRILLWACAVGVPHWRARSQIEGEFSGLLSEFLSGREDLQANGAVSYVMRRFYEFLQQGIRIFYRARFSNTLMWATPNALFTVGNVLALGIGSYLWSQDIITLGTIYLLFAYTNLLQSPLERIQEELTDLQQAQASIYRIRELLDSKPKIKYSGSTLLPDKALSVRFTDVRFTYGEFPQNKSPMTLENISFYLTPGQTLGILWRTGSGKTTLSRLLLRLYEYQEGEIYLGDIPIRDIALSDLRKKVSLVTQDVQLFQASVRQNLTLFDPGIPDQKIHQALQILGLSEWIGSLDAPLGTDGVGLSAGQAQLLAFARIFLRDPGLIILDEASSRLDPTTEARIELALDQLLAHRTCIIIAHRLKTLQRVDQILMLENGRVVEYGSRQGLLRIPDSRFAQLLKSNRDPAA